MKTCKISLMTAAAALALSSGAALAQSAGDWTLGLGVALVEPDNNNDQFAGLPTNIQSSVRPILTAEYFVMDNVGIELLASWPFSHDVQLNGSDAAEVDLLPPTLSLQYHFANSSPITPFIGAGVNWTLFFNEDSPLGNIKVDNSLGLALHAGFDYQVTDRGSLRADVRWFDLDADAELNGADIGKVDINPFVFGVSYVYRF